MRVREIDDLHLIECGMCHGCGTVGTRKARCPACRGTGDRVIRRIKFYYVQPKRRVKR